MINRLEKEYGKKLPESYLEFLNNEEVLELIVIEYEDIDLYDNRYWTLLTAEELLYDLEMKGVGKSKNFECLKLYLQVFNEFSNYQYTDSNVGKISLDRIEISFVFGEENGDYLYFDPNDDYSIWIYYHEGGDVKKVSNSFDDILKNQ